MGVKQSAIIRCPAHLAHVRGFACAVANQKGAHECFGKIEAAHVRTGTDGGMGMKPSDCFVIPLCSDAHREQHRVGEAEFERIYGISMRKIADRLWKASPAGKRWRAENGEGR